MTKNKRILAPHIHEGDIIGIYSPSGAIRNKAQYNKGIKFLSKLGFKYKESCHLFDWQSHYSSDGKTKAADFHSLVEDENVKAVIASVGGHTAIHMISHLNWELIAKHPKIYIGFSDNSLIVNLITEKTGLITFHTGIDIMYGFGDFGEKNSVYITEGQFTVKEIIQTIYGHRYPGKVKKLTDWIVLREGKAEGVLKGGNLDTLQAIIGTPYSINWENAIFFWESTDDPHRIDLFFSTLSLSGVLDQISGMIVGKPINCIEKFYPEKHESIEEIILRYSQNKKYPIIINADIGHGMENSCIPIGANAIINDDTLEVIEEVVK